MKNYKCSPRVETFVSQRNGPNISVSCHISKILCLIHFAQNWIKKSFRMCLTSYLCVGITAWNYMGWGKCETYSLSSKTFNIFTMPLGCYMLRHASPQILRIKSWGLNFEIWHIGADYYQHFITLSAMTSPPKYSLFWQSEASVLPMKIVAPFPAVWCPTSRVKLNTSHNLQCQHAKPPFIFHEIRTHEVRSQEDIKLIWSFFQKKK